MRAALAARCDLMPTIRDRTLPGYPFGSVTHDAEMDALVTMLEEAGLAERHTDEDGRPALRLTDRGAQVGRALAMGGEAADEGAGRAPAR